jgi:hypothetical protein
VCWEAEDWQRQQDEEHACQEVTAWRAVEGWKEVEAQKVEVEQREHSTQDRKVWEVCWNI